MIYGYTRRDVADIGIILVPADSKFSESIAVGPGYRGSRAGQSRRHALLLKLLGVKQIIIGINKMDCDSVVYKEGRYEEIKEEMKKVLTKVGWKKEYVEKSVPFLPISVWVGDNVIKKSDDMPWIFKDKNRG
jgi:elongation factor 1-alpha